jgi:hypothetical protein
MDFLIAIVFLALFVLRPQDWGAIFSGLQPVKLVMILAVASLVFRKRSVGPGDFFRTPHDWALLAFFAWLVVTHPTPWTIFKQNINLLVFYYFIVLTLNTRERIEKFLGWWTALLVIVAAFALGQYAGFDPFGSREITEFRMKGRLMLNLNIYNNPNALGHNLAPVLAMIYFFCCWKRPVLMKTIGWAALALPLWAIYLTLSKGAFLAAAATLITAYTFGRPKYVQVIVIAVALAFGQVALSKLPRMQELSKTKGNEAIAGRVAAFKHGLRCMENSWRGVGKDYFLPTFIKEHRYNKSAHSGWVQYGSELGKTGLFFVLLFIWTGLRTLIFFRTDDPEKERLRRVLFVMLVAYCVSCWMIDFGYKPQFFLFMAAIAALHRLHYGLAEQPEPDPEPVMPWLGRLVPVGSVVPTPVGAPSMAMAAAAGNPVSATAKAVPVAALEPEPLVARPVRIGRSVEVEAPTARSFWNRIGFIDLAVAFLLFEVVSRIWHHAVKQL